MKKLLVLISFVLVAGMAQAENIFEFRDADNAIKGTIESDGTLVPDYLRLDGSSITVTGSGGFINVVESSVTAAAFFGDGSNLTGITVSSVSANAVAGGVLDSDVFVSTLPLNIVGTTQIIDGEVNEADLATDSVTSVKIASQAVTTEEIANGTITNTDINDVDASKVTAGTFSGAFTFDTELTVNGLIMKGAFAASDLIDGTVTCTTGAGTCLALNTTDFDLYASTGTGTGQWRNVRRGVGPRT